MTGRLATLAAVYLPEEVLGRLKPQFEDGGPHTIYLYEFPFRKARE